MEKVKVKKRIHHGYTEMLKAREAVPSLSQMFGKYQYIYSSKKGEISLVELPNYLREGQDLWEIYCLKGDLFDDVERFDTKEEAEEKAKKYLN